MKLKKRCDIGHSLEWNEIEIIDCRLHIIANVEEIPWGDNVVSGSVYEYEYIYIGTHSDGTKTLQIMDESDFESALFAYEVVNPKRFSITSVSPVKK